MGPGFYFRRALRPHIFLLRMILLTTCISVGSAAASLAAEEPLFHDSHFHLTNYIMEGTDMGEYVEMMSNTVGRSTVFGLPLQQMWSYRNTGDFAPYYYLQTDAPLYYYSFTDAQIAMAYRALPPEQQARLDPMITGFNPTDMYGVDHIKRVLKLFPGVFSGLGEFTIHKEFVSSKIAGNVANLTDPALDRIFAFAGEAGLPIILHNDLNTPFPKDGQEPYMLRQLKELFERHPDTTIIWAHIGLGRVVRPLPEQLAIVERICSSPSMSHVYMDISWDEVAKYATVTPEAVESAAKILNKYPDRFLFGTDVVAPQSLDNVTAVYHLWDPVWALLSPEAKEMITKGNYERIFDQARKDVRVWEEAHKDEPLRPTKWSPASGYVLPEN
jgi:hypothetical protein